MRTTKIGRIWLVCVGLFALGAAPAFWPPGETDAWTWVLGTGLGLALTLLAAIDIETLRLPDALTFPLAAAGLAVTYAFAPADVIWHLAAAASAYLLLFTIAEIFLRTRGVDALGMGDAKLFAAAGAWLGFEGLPGVLLLSSLSALVAAAVGIAVGAKVMGAKIGRTTRIPFGPFLAAGFWLTWLYGSHILF